MNTLDFTVRNTALGTLMMATNERGVCAVHLGESAEDVHAELSREFPVSTLRASTATHITSWASALEAHMVEGAPRPDVPLDVRGTPFQLRVWNFLSATKQGDVLTYKKLAEEIGAPTAIRAAASACAANRIAILIPCHRVLRGDGGLGGYRWGEARKRTLLDTEASFSVRA